MTVKDLQEYFLNTETPKFFLVDVFSWRGIYDEVAFTDSDTGSREESLKLIDMAITERFAGWKDDEFCRTFDVNTEVHFEPCESACTNNTAENYLRNKYNVIL